MPSHIMDYLLTYGKSKACPLFFCRKKGIEDFIQHKYRNTGSVIANFYIYPFLVYVHFLYDHKLASVCHGLNPVFTYI